MPFLRPTIFALLLWSTAALAAPALVAVDVGHGVKDSGALSAPAGRPEFEFNQVFAGVLADALRSQQLGVSRNKLRRRYRQPGSAAGSGQGQRLLHFNPPRLDQRSLAAVLGLGWREASYTEVKRGYGIFVSAQNPDLSTSLRCASTIGAMLRRAGFVPSHLARSRHLAADAENGVWYYDNLVVLYRTTLPAVLFEAGVIKHREEELELRDPERQARMADAVATGIAACLSVREISVPASDPPQTSP